MERISTQFLNNWENHEIVLAIPIEKIPTLKNSTGATGEELRQKNAAVAAQSRSLDLQQSLDVVNEQGSRRRRRNRERQANAIRQADEGTCRSKLIANA
ncbi:unnamed protein product [Haemonchus placei]|uniref:BZIP domain-containing protein n=1 Tax=Haemonchus placei TaxID=6290 RepID=A0A0N4WWD0_HAEPC|nr:unnamed protein product [Haemonchus placei]